MRVRSLVFVSLLVLAPMPAVAQPTAPIRGVVTDATTGLPVREVFVHVLDGSAIIVASAQSAPDGSFETNAIPSGTYYAYTANGQSYLNKVYNNVPCDDDCSSYDTIVAKGTPIVVSAPAARTGVDFALLKGATVSGRVTDAATGLGLANVFVSLRAGHGRSAALATTNSNGNFVTSVGLPAGTYYVTTANYQGYLNEAFDNQPCVGECPLIGTPIVLAAGQVRTDINFALSRGGRVSGTVKTAATGEPISGRVDIYSSAGAHVSEAPLNSSGSFTSLIGLPTGTYYAVSKNSGGYLDEIYDNVVCGRSGCSASDAVALGAPIAVTTGATTSGIDFRLSNGGAISGKVTNADTGAAVKGVEVRANGPGNAFGQAETDVNGEYTIGGLPAGAYALNVDADEHGLISEIYDGIACLVTCTDEDAVLRGTRVNVALDATSARIDFALAPGGGLRGTVTSAASGTPLAGVSVRVVSVTADVTAVSEAQVTGPSGVFNVGSLASGSYYVFTENSAGYLDEAFGNVPCLGDCPGVAVLGTPVTVTAGGQTAGVDFALDAGARISGVVTDAASSAPLEDVYITVIDPAGRFVGSMFSDFSGAFTTGAGLAAGTYFMLAEGDNGYLHEVFGGVHVPCDDECPNDVAAAVGTPIEVEAGATTGGQNLALDRGARIAGTVTEAGSGVVVPFQPLRIVDAAGRVVTTADTDALGRYQTQAGISDGSYFGFTRTDTHLNQIYDNIPCPAGCLTSTAPAGTPIPVTAGATATGVNFALARRTGVPGVPRAVELRAHPQGVVIAWDPPATGGAANTYRVEVGLSPGTTAVNLPASDTSYVLTGAPAGRYFLRVRAINASGAGPASDETALVIGGGGLLPSAPVRARAWMTGSRLMMTWEAPETGGAPTHYLVEAGTASGLANIATIPAATRAFTYDPVPAGFYFLRVRAANATGASAPSNEMMLVAGGAGSPPYAPVSVGAAVAGSTVTFAWTPPAGAVTGYILEAGSVRGASNLAVVRLDATTTVSFGGIPPGTYYVRLRAANAIGVGMVSEEIVVVVGS